MQRWSPLFAATAVVAIGAISWRYLVDDAFIVARYAANLVAGDGWAMNPGAPSDGITGPLWLLCVAAPYALGADPLDAQRLVGMLAAGLAVALVVRDQPGQQRGLTALLIALQGAIGIWAGAGLETGLTTLALALVARPALGAGSLGWASAGAALLPWLRPELIGAAAVLALGAEGKGRRVLLGALGAGVAGVVAFRLALFGQPLPLASAAKLGGLGDGLRYATSGVALVTGLGGVALVGAAARVGGAGRLVAGALLVHLLSVTIAGGDWMPAHRLFVPVLPLYAVAAARGFEAMGSRWRWPALAAATVLPAVLLVLQVRLAWEGGQTRVKRGPAVAELVRDRGPVALVDVGYVGWATGVEVIDLGGVTDPVIARAPGGHLAKRVPLGHLVERGPRAILLHSARRPEADAEGRLTALAGYPVEQRVAAFPWVRANFRVGAITRYGPGYWYVRLDRVAEE